MNGIGDGGRDRLPPPQRVFREDSVCRIIGLAQPHIAAAYRIRYRRWIHLCPICLSGSVNGVQHGTVSGIRWIIVVTYRHDKEFLPQDGNAFPVLSAAFAVKAPNKESTRKQIRSQAARCCNRCFIKILLYLLYFNSVKKMGEPLLSAQREIFFCPVG